MRAILFLLVCIATAPTAHGQYTFSQPVSGTITVSSVLNVSISGGATITFTSLDDYANGRALVNYATCTLKSNLLWLVNVKANATYFTASGGGSTNMPANIISIRKSGTSTYYPLSAVTAVNLATGSRTGGSPFYTTFNVDLKANPGYDYNGGTYSIGLIYTLTNQ